MAKRWRLKNMRLDRVDLVTAGANPGAHVMIAKFDDTDPMSNGVEPSDTVEGEVRMSEPAVEALEPQTTEDVDMGQEPETVAKADYEAIAKSLEDAKAEIAKMRRDQKTAEYVAKAKDLANLGEADELGALMLAASEAFSAEQYQTFERLLKAANAKVDKGELFAQFADGAAEVEDDTFESKLEKLAKAKVDAGQAPTREQAVLQVLNENPALRAEYRA